MKKYKWILTSIIALFVSTSMAWAYVNTSGYKFSTYAGWQWATLNPSTFSLVGNETQWLVPNNQRGTAFTGGLGAGYRFLINKHQKLLRYTHDITLDLDIFYFETKQQGITWEYAELPNFDYLLKVKSTRFLANMEWTFLPILTRLYPFFELGIGFALNENNYTDTPLTGNSVGLHFKTYSVIQFAYDIGAGLKLMPSKHWEISLRYLYTDAGSAQSGTTANLPVATAYHLPLKVQSLLFGLAYLF